MPIQSNQFQNLARAVSAYSDEAYTEARRLTGTGIVDTDARISGSAEDYYGTIRWYKPLGSISYHVSGSPTDDTDGSTTYINVASQEANDGAKTSISTEVAEYIKTVRTHGADEYQVQRVVSQQDGLAKIARDFAETRARDENIALQAVLNGVARQEAVSSTGTGTGQTSPDTLQELAASNSNGFFVDLSDTTVQGFFNTSGDNDADLIDDSISSASARLERLIAVTSIGFKDLEEDFYYLVVQPSEYLKLKQANVIDETQNIVEEGNIRFETILNGKFRLLVSRSAPLSQASVGNVAAASTKTSFVLRPGAVSFTDVSVPNPVAFDRDESQGLGTGTTELWYRWGYIYHPRGYTFDGLKTGFARNDTSVGTKASIQAYNSTNSTPVSPWTRTSDLLNLGILPIFHT